MSIPLQDDGSLRVAAQTLLAAAAGATLVLATSTRPWRGRDLPSPAFGAPLALASALALGFAMSRGLPAFPPAETLHWIFYAALAGGLYGAWEGTSGRRARLARAGLSVALPLVLLEFQRERHWGRSEGILWSAGLAALLFVGWNALGALEERRPGSAALALGLAFASALAAGAYAFAGGSIFTLLPAALALAVGLCALLGSWRRSSGLGAPGVAPFVLVHFGLVWVARWLYELSTAGFVLLSLVPLAAAPALFLPALRPRTRAALVFGAPVALAAAALLAEWSAAPEPYY